MLSTWEQLELESDEWVAEGEHTCGTCYWAHGTAEEWKCRRSGLVMTQDAAEPSCWSPRWSR